MFGFRRSVEKSGHLTRCVNENGSTEISGTASVQTTKLMQRGSDGGLTFGWCYAFGRIRNVGVRQIWYRSYSCK